MGDRYHALDHRIRLDYVMDAIRRLKPRRVVDLGCGRTPIQDMDFELYVGVDTAEPMPGFSEVWWGGPNFTFLKANYEEPLDLPAEFDLVLWLEGPEHTLKHQQVFSNIHRLLTPGGFLIITCPMSRGWSVHPQHEHKCSFSLEALHQMVEKNGFTVLEMAKVYSRIQEHLIGYHWLFCLATNAKYDPRYVK